MLLRCLPGDRVGSMPPHFDALVCLEHYLPLDGMINIPIYLVWGCWVQLNSIAFVDHITFNNEYMKHAHTRQRMTNNNNNNKRKQA